MALGYITTWVIKLHNKRAIISPIVLIIAIALILVVAFALFSKGAFGFSKAHSLTQKVSGYNEDNCKDIGVVVSGNVNIEDSAVFDLEPSIRDVSVTEVTASGKSLLAFGTEQFTYEVEAIDEVTNERLDTFRGSGELRSADNKGISKPYSVDFVIADNNCDHRIYYFNIKVKATLMGYYIGEWKEYEKLVRVRGGRVIK